METKIKLYKSLITKSVYFFVEQNYKSYFKSVTPAEFAKDFRTESKLVILDLKSSREDVMAAENIIASSDEELYAEFCKPDKVHLDAETELATDYLIRWWLKLIVAAFNKVDKDELLLTIALLPKECGSEFYQYFELELKLEFMFTLFRYDSIFNILNVLHRELIKLVGDDEYQLMDNVWLVRKNKKLTVFRKED